MLKQVIRTSDAPASPLFSQAVKVGGTVYVSGIVGADPKTGEPAGATVQEQTRQALVNCENILKAAGAEYAKFFPHDPPARAVSRLGPELSNVLVSIKMIAVLGAGGGSL